MRGAARCHERLEGHGERLVSRAPVSIYAAPPGALKHVTAFRTDPMAGGGRALFAGVTVVHLASYCNAPAAAYRTISSSLSPSISVSTWCVCSPRHGAGAYAGRVSLKSVTGPSYGVGPMTVWLSTLKKSRCESCASS